MEFWVTVAPDGTVGLSGRVTLFILKNQAKNMPIRKGSGYVSLPATHAFQDTLRLLVTLALFKQHVEHASSWEGIFRLETSSSGRRLNFKESSLSLPVFRVWASTDASVTSAWMSQSLQLASRVAECRHGVTSDACRRFAEFVLDQHVSADERRSYMGYSS